MRFKQFLLENKSTRYRVNGWAPMNVKALEKVIPSRMLNRSGDINMQSELGKLSAELSRRIETQSFEHEVVNLFLLDLYDDPNALSISKTEALDNAYKELKMVNITVKHFTLNVKVAKDTMYDMMDDTLKQEDIAELPARDLDDVPIGSYFEFEIVGPSTKKLAEIIGTELICIISGSGDIKDWMGDVEVETV